MNMVSVIVPIYNVEKYLCECLDSIINQTYRNLQIILVDDGSPDNCGAICDEYAKLDVRVEVLHCKNGGLSVARNRGYNVCKGEYVLFVDSDDYLEKNAIEVLCSHMQQDNLQMLFYDALSFDETSTEVKEEEINKYIRKADYSSVSSGAQLFLEFLKNDEYRSPVQYCLFKKSFIDENKLSFHEGIIHEDEEFTFLSLLCAKRVKHINDVLYHHRFRSDSIMGAKTSKKNTDGCYQVISAVIDAKDKFLTNIGTKEAYQKGVARLVEIFLNRVRCSVDKKSAQTKKQVKEIKRKLRSHNYFESDDVKFAALDKRHKKIVRKKIKIRVYSLLSPVLKLIRRK
ncbi:MAG: glycosyltransferase [Eubacteriales bacterium]|nr:glycosyltransferase [Eubacteriales bacterium]